MSTDGTKIGERKNFDDDEVIRVKVEQSELPLAFYIIMGFSIIMTLLFILSI